MYDPPPSRPCYICDRTVRLPEVYVADDGEHFGLCGYHKHMVKKVRLMLQKKRLISEAMATLRRVRRDLTESP